MPEVSETRTGAIVLARMWQKMIVWRGIPYAIAAWTHSRFRIRRTSPRGRPREGDQPLEELHSAEASHAHDGVVLDAGICAAALWQEVRGLPSLASAWLGLRPSAT